ncbi:MAG: histidine triad nucleotide-binding protein [Clostridiales Family XIII bacterium]|jgi:histidine triad (HIT) family protein|nr:histidine triad nucleotide-binding protein [Clostridiales Family XIII bacterium]
MSDCIFCKIANKDIPAKIVFEDEQMLAFHDLEPQAPVHVLLIPKKHFASLNDVTQSAEDKEILGHLLTKVHEIAEILELDNGYRLVSNCGEDGMQTVQHLHFHLLGKRKLTWPPG